MKKNMSRRHFLKMGGLALAAMSVHLCRLPLSGNQKRNSFPCVLQ